jgi:hypothetical protein
MSKKVTKSAIRGMSYDDLMAHVGWGDDVVCGFLWTFIAENDLEEKAEEYLSKIAREECGVR